MTSATRAGDLGALFPQTRWTIILSASGNDSAESRAAFEKICLGYWKPLYTYIRRFGYAQHDAEDLTQDFFARLLAGDQLGSADREKGRFRSFLLTALKRFMVNEWERARAQKRGGGLLPVPFDTALAENIAGNAAGALPDKAYDFECALAMLNNALEQLRKEFSQEGKADEFEILKPHLASGRGEIPYEKVAASLHRDPGAARVAVHRFRKRYRQIFRELVARTVARQEDVDDEVRYLMSALG